MTQHRRRIQGPQAPGCEADRVSPVPDLDPSGDLRVLEGFKSRHDHSPRRLGPVSDRTPAGNYHCHWAAQVMFAGLELSYLVEVVAVADARRLEELVKAI